MPDLRVVILGDELLTGAGDPKGIGWLGRVQAR
ncbi:MAG: lysophospholipase, partial [Aquiluna sp.]